MLSLATLMMRSAGNLPYVKSAGDIFTELPIRNTLLQFSGPLGNSGVIHFLQFATGPTDSGCINRGASGQWATRALPSNSDHY